MAMKRKSRLRNVTILLPIIPVCLFLLWVFAHGEFYCFFYPAIDTVYAPGYSEAGFAQIAPGMSIKEVEQTLGSPMHTLTNKDGLVRWCYTGDGKCIARGWKLADFAWLGREIIFRENKVAEIVKLVYND